MEKLEELLDAFETAILNYKDFFSERYLSSDETPTKKYIKTLNELELKVEITRRNIMESVTKLKNTEYYFNTLDGSMIAINWLQNRPAGNNWVSITKQCYEVHK